MPKILLIEDDRDMATTILDALAQERHVVETAHDGLLGEDLLKTGDFDCVVLDWDLPGKPGIEILKAHRARGKRTPIIMLTGKGMMTNKEEGFDSGADDYLTKPFDVRELVVRIRALLRRGSELPSNTIIVNDLELDPVKYKLKKNGAEVHLTPKDFALLEFLMRNPDHVFSVQTILSRVFSYDSTGSAEGLRAAIRRIRKVIDATDDPTESMIENVARVGYRLRTR